MKISIPRAADPRRRPGARPSWGHRRFLRRAWSSGKMQPPTCLRPWRFPLRSCAVRCAWAGLEHRRGRCRTLSCRSEKACKCNLEGTVSSP